MRKITVDVERCTGCQLCALACSYEIGKYFNPRMARIVIRQELIGATKSIDFIDNCDVNIIGACSGANGEPPCIALCSTEALRVITGG